jgi:two-component sensor histidine kinase
MLRSGGRERKIAPLNMRTTPAVRTKLEAAARTSGRSLVQEVEHRITRSLDRDEAYGGPELRGIADLMAASFAVAGQYSAGSGVPPSEWLRDPAARITAITSVVDALVRSFALDDHEMDLLLGSIRGALATRIANRHAEEEQRR